MDEAFEIPVLYKNEELHFPARLVSSGWTHRIEVEVYGLPLFFERDEEREWRALLPPGQLQDQNKIDVELLKQIIHSLSAILDS